MKEFFLAVDGSTYAGTVAVMRGPQVIAERSLPDSGIPARGQRGEDFMPMVVECMGEARLTVGDLERVICGAGPGSFTSLRIAASIAKGIAAGAGIPLYSVSSLLLIPSGCDVGPGAYLSTLPAMRGESYLVAVDAAEDGTFVTDGIVTLVPAADAEKIARESGRMLVGPGSGKNLKPHARGARHLLDQILAAGPCDLNTWEPAYGRLADAQVKWEAAHGRPLASNA